MTVLCSATPTTRWASVLTDATVTRCRVFLLKGAGSGPLGPPSSRRHCRLLTMAPKGEDRVPPGERNFHRPPVSYASRAEAGHAGREPLGTPGAADGRQVTGRVRIIPCRQILLER